MATIYNKDSMSKSEVKKMQQALVDAGYSVGSSGVDGIWGKDTAAALSKYKESIGQNNTYGTTVGDSTLNKLYGKDTSKTTSSTPSTPSTPSTSVPTVTYTPTASAYDSDIAGYQSMIGGIDNAIANAGTTYQNIASMYDPTAQNEALKQAMNANAGQINSLYDNSARDYYRLYKTQQKALPENLSRAGVTGGASESSQLKLMNAYSDNLYRNESARDNALAGNTANYNDQIAKNSMDAANKLASYYQSYQNQVNNLNMQKAEAQAGLQSAITSQNAAASVDKWNASVTDRINQQLGREGGDTLWTYTTPDGKLHWTTYEDNAKALSSLYDLNKISSVTKKASGEQGGNPAGDPKPPVVPTTTSTGYSYDTLRANMTNALLKGATAEQLQNFTAPIEYSYSNGTISEPEARDLLDLLKGKNATSGERPIYGGK